MKSVNTLEKTTFSGRRFTRRQLARVQETVETFPHLSRSELAHTICEHLNWKTPRGTNKVDSALVLLKEMEARGVVAPPAKNQRRPAVRRKIPLKQAEPRVSGSLAAIEPVSLVLASSDEERTCWKSYVETYHYLGYKRPIGSYLYYFAVSEPREQKLGCLSFSASATWALAPRDKWIGWEKKHKQKLLNLILVQNRFLVFPWVDIQNLATKILALSTAQVGDDWVRVYGYRPVLVETFVDTRKYTGASYKAANWRYLGETQGRGRGPKHEREKSRKAIYAYPLRSDWQQYLTGSHQMKSMKRRYRNDVQSAHTRFVGKTFVELWERVVHILQEVARQYDEKWRIRKRVLDSLLLMLLIFRLVSSRNTQSYGTTIDELWDSCDQLGVQLPQKSSVAASSFCEARSKLDEEIFKCTNRRILDAYASQDSQYTWLGHRLFAVDGSKLNLPPKLVTSGYKRPSEGAHYPQGLLSCLYQLKSQLPVDFDLVSHANERECARRHLEVLHKDDVVVYDRGYFSYEMLHQHYQADVHAIFRLEENSYTVIRDFFSSSQADTLATIFPSDKKRSKIRKKHPDLDIIPLEMRLLKYQVQGSTFCLGTTLVEPDQHYPLQEFMDVYHARWGIEELYKISKRIYTIEEFHAKSERGVKQEIFAHFVLITMNRLFANQADLDLPRCTGQRSTVCSENTAAPPTTMHTIKTNFKNCIHVFSRCLEHLLCLQSQLKTAVQRVYKRIAGRFQRVRPNRSYPRKSMRPETKWYPSKEKRKKTQKNIGTKSLPPQRPLAPVLVS